MWETDEGARPTRAPRAQLDAPAVPVGDPSSDGEPEPGPFRCHAPGGVAAVEAVEGYGSERRRVSARAVGRAGIMASDHMTSLLQVAHVVLGVIAVGTNLSFPIWTYLAQRDGTSLAFTLRAVRWVDRWVTIPAYLLTVGSGIALVVIERVDPLATWIAGSALLFVVLMGLGVVLYRPVSRRRLAAAQHGPLDDRYRRSARDAAFLDAAILGAALAILALMVVRPA